MSLLWYTKFKKKAKHSFTVVKLDFTVNFSFRTVNYSYDSLTILFIFKMLIIVKSLQIVKLYLSDALCFAIAIPNRDYCVNYGLQM